MSGISKDERRKRTSPMARAQVLAYIQDQIAAGKPFPTVSSIARHLDWPYDRAYDCVLMLAGNGDIIIVERTAWGGKLRNHYGLPQQVNA